MYDDLSYGSAEDYDASSGKTAVGIINWVSEDGKDVKIVNLKDLTFSSRDKEGNFNPDNPYVGNTKRCGCSSPSVTARHESGEAVYKNGLLRCLRTLQ